MVGQVKLSPDPAGDPEPIYTAKTAPRTDNFANIPMRYFTGTPPTSPGPDATTLANGDAGARAACGVID